MDHRIATLVLVLSVMSRALEESTLDRFDAPAVVENVALVQMTAGDCITLTARVYHFLIGRHSTKSRNRREGACQRAG